MTFQAYIDNIQAKTGKTPADFQRLARAKGLMTPDVKDLNRVIADCKRLVPTIKELVDKLGESGEEFKQIGTDTVALGNKAHDVLTTDYADSYTRSPRNARDRRP